MKDPIKVKQGKQSRQQGVAFEKRVRLDLECKGFICDRWTNNLELDYHSGGHFVNGKYITKGKIIPAKPAYSFNPKLKMRIPLVRNTGFPDFICFKKANLNYLRKDAEELRILGDLKFISNLIIEEQPKECLVYSEVYEIIGIECKINGILSKQEKEKCDWYLDNKIFSKILVAEKHKVKNKIIIEYKQYVTTKI